MLLENGINNTSKLIEIWNTNTIQKDDNDIWKNIQDKYKEGYFIPTTGECIAAFNQLEITSENYSSYELSDFYTSSHRSSESVYSTWLYKEMFNGSYRNHNAAGTFRLFAKF